MKCCERDTDGDGNCDRHPAGPKLRQFPIMQGKLRKGIPWAMIAPHEAQALRNHDQTLERLAQRGGLSPEEAVAVLEDRKWRAMPHADGVLESLVNDWARCGR